jgi:hypothetical protein
MIKKYSFWNKKNINAMDWKKYLCLYPQTVKRVGQYLFETENFATFSENGFLIMKVGKKLIRINHFDFIKFFDHCGITSKCITNEDSIVALIDRKDNPSFSIRVEIENSILDYYDIVIEVMSKKHEEMYDILHGEISIEDSINAAIKEVLGLTEQDVNKKTRKRDIVQARQIKMVVLNKLGRYDLSKTGKICGGKDHATVIHAAKTFKNLYETDKYYRRKVNEIFEHVEINHNGSLSKLLNIMDLENL